MKKEFLKSIAYKALDLLTFRKGISRTVNGIRLKFPARWHRYYGREYETENYQFLKTWLQPGMTVIDIGGHIGLFSVSCARIMEGQGTILCFEPTPGTFRVLQKTIRLNRYTQIITALQAAISDFSGTAEFYTDAEEGCNSNSLVKQEKISDHKYTYQVNVRTLDSVVNEMALKPALVKIDAEGAEYQVLKGALSTIHNYRPLIILGMHPQSIIQNGDTTEEIWDLLSNEGYIIYYESKPIGRSEFVNQKNLFDVQCRHSDMNK